MPRRHRRPTLALRTRFVESRLDRTIWLAPVATAVVVGLLPQKDMEYVIAGAIGLPLLAWVSARPDRAVVALAVFLPLETIGFGFLLGLHVPAGILRPASAFKELMGIALLLAAVREIRARQIRLDFVDLSALAYLGVVTVYLVLPHLLSSLQDTFSVRLLAWRADCGYVLLFFAVRHAPISLEGLRRYWKAVVGLGVLAVLAGLFQAAAPSTWSHLLLHQGKALQFDTEVLHDPLATANSALAYLENLHPLRVSSILESPFDLSDYLLIVLAVVLARITRADRSRWMFALLGGVLAVLFFTRVRADALAALVMIAVAVVPAPRKPTEARVRLVGAVLLGLIIIGPALAGTRFVGAQGGSASDSGHFREVSAGINVLVANPLGVGLGSNAATANRFLLSSSNLGATTSDNAVTQVGDELGFEGLVPWLAFVVSVLVVLRRRAADGDALVAAGGFALVGVLIAGQYHQVFLNYDVTWTLWAAAGLAVSTAEVHRRAEDPGNITTSPIWSV
jgi:hypothetical protein